MRHLLCALGAEYYTVQLGQFTGVNPFQFHDSPGLRQMLFDLVLSCLRWPTHVARGCYRQIRPRP
ncbi:hypothetical protein BKM09_028145 (plasmid) [Pseudomonas amygdali pv. morsprunorum]|nr:hypothetical protein BKM09_028145 [Pseudomonas amygdali pv. morsprunorum]